MNATIRQTLAQRSIALALAAVVTLSLMVGIDSLAAHEAGANALLAQQAGAALAHS
jgi:hypothetical protein